MPKRKLHGGLTSFMDVVFIRDTSNTTRVAGNATITASSAGLKFGSFRLGASGSVTYPIGSGTLGTDGGNTSVTIVACDTTYMAGHYQLTIPNAFLAAISAAGHMGASWHLSGGPNMDDIPGFVELDNVDYSDSIHFGLQGVSSAALTYDANSLVKMNASTVGIGGIDSVTLTSAVYNEIQLKVTGGAYTLATNSLGQVQSDSTQLAPTNPTAGTWGECMTVMDAFAGRNNVATGATSTTLQLDGGASTVAGSYVGDLVKILSGTGAGQQRTILANNGAASPTVTVDRPWVTTPDNTSRFFTVHVSKVDAYLVDSDTLAAPNAAGNLPLDLANVKNPTTAVNLSATSVGFVDAGNVNVSSINNIATSAVTTVNQNQGTTQPVNFSGSGATAYVKADAEQINGQGTSATGTITFPNATLASTTNITAGTIATVSGNVNGSVGSVTGSISGNVLGSVGSVTGSVNGNVLGSVGSVTGSVSGSVSSVTGNVGGNVLGSVGSVTGSISGNLNGNVNGNVLGSVGSVTSTVGANVLQWNGNPATSDTNGVPIVDAYWSSGYSNSLLGLYWSTVAQVTVGSSTLGASSTSFVSGIPWGNGTIANFAGQYIRWVNGLNFGFTQQISSITHYVPTNKAQFNFAEPGEATFAVGDFGFYMGIAPNCVTGSTVPLGADSNGLPQVSAKAGGSSGIILNNPNAAGNWALDWANVLNQTTSVDLSNTTTSFVTTAAAVTGNVTLGVNGADSGAFTTNTRTFLQAGLATPTNITAGIITTVSGNVLGSVGSVTSTVTANVTKLNGSTFTFAGPYVGTAQPIQFDGNNYPIVDSGYIGGSFCGPDLIGAGGGYILAAVTSWGLATLNGLPAVSAVYLGSSSIGGGSGSGTVTVNAFIGTDYKINVTSAGKVSEVVLVDTLTTYTGNTPQTGDAFARIGATGSGLTSLAPASTALSTLQWTNARAGYLDNLNVGGAVASHADAVALSSQIGSPMQAGSTVVLTDGSLTTAKLGSFVLAKGTNITGFNDIAATAIVSAGPITTSSGKVSEVILTDSIGSTTGTLGVNVIMIGSQPVTASAPIVFNPAVGTAYTIGTDSLGHVTLGINGIDPILVESGITPSAALVDDNGNQLSSIHARQALSLLASVLAGVVAGGGSATLTFAPAGKPLSSPRVIAVGDDSFGDRSLAVVRVPH